MMSRIEREEYEVLEVIGKGSFGIVRKVRLLLEDKIYVRKEIDYSSMNSHERNQLISELRILRELDHPNIVKYYRHEHIAETKTIFIYMEYCNGGDLARLISNFRRNGESVPEEFVWQVLVQILLALHRCHYGFNAKEVNLYANSETEPAVNSETVVIHRDIKPDNIFLLNSEKAVKLGDFGLAKMLTSLSQFAKTYVGTPYYMSPEVLMDEPYTPVCDIWSLGCVLFELCTLKPPFQAKTHLQLQNKIKQGKFPELPESYSPQIRDIIRECITVDANLRPSCYELLECLSVKFLRKEIGLKEQSENLDKVQLDLLHKSEELTEKEHRLNEVREDFKSRKEELEEKLSIIQKKFEIRQSQLEDELIEEFEMRKAAMDQEAKEVRLGYQREFKLVVENEVQRRVKEILAKYNNELTIKSPDLLQNYSAQLVHTTYEHSFPQKLRGPKELVEDNVYKNFQVRRSPLKARNELPDIRNLNLETGKAYLKENARRQTDELERINTEKRNVPEFEELYLRQKRH